MLWRSHVLHLGHHEHERSQRLAQGFSRKLTNLERFRAEFITHWNRIPLRFTPQMPSAPRVRRPLSRTAIASATMSSSMPENRLLGALPPAEFARLTARMTDITLGHKDLLYRAGGPIEHVYFPRTGVLSAVVVMLDGQAVEAMVIGKEGMAGASVVLGGDRSTEQVFCQIPPSECRKMRATEFAAEVAKTGPLRDIVFGYIRAAMTVSARQTACNALHTVEERCVRWLLMCHDRAESDEFKLTHDFLATMLGVRRATVTVTAGALQSAGLLTYRHGKVKILDRSELEEATCECYQSIRGVFEPSSGSL